MTPGMFYNKIILYKTRKYMASVLSLLALVTFIPKLLTAFIIMINIFGNQILGEKAVAMETPNSYSSQIFRVLHGVAIITSMNLK